MTLVISAVTRNHVFQVSDRLITVTSKPKLTVGPWDLHSNKSAIVIGRDCWLVMGYSGLAYMNGKPTDQFIAEAVSRETGLQGGMLPWWPPQDLHYKGITDRISSALSDAYSHLSPITRVIPTTVSGVGVQRTRKRLRQLAFRFDASLLGVKHHDMTDPYQALSTFSHLPIGTVDSTVYARMRANLKEHGDESPEVFRDRHDLLSRTDDSRWMASHALRARVRILWGRLRVLWGRLRAFARRCILRVSSAKA